MQDIMCRSCGRKLMTAKAMGRLIKFCNEKGLRDYEAFLTLCSECKLKSLSEKLIGRELEKVPRSKPIPQRRAEKVQPVKPDPRLGTTVYKSECFSCNQGCDAAVHVKGGRVVKVEGDPSSHVTKGVLCSKGLASKEHLYHKDRILHPLKRIGERGKGKWKKISWDEALDTIADRLKEIEERYDKEGIMFASGTSRGWLQPFFRLANAYGCQFTAPGTAQCALPRWTGSVLVTGTRCMENPDYENTRSMIIWGANPTSTFPVKGRRMMEAWARGAKMIVVDPMFTEAASKADLWLQLRPGSDAALALGMLHVIIKDQIYDREFVDTWCYGFDELTERIAAYSPERVEEITWVPREKVIQAARLYAQERPSSITQVVAIEQVADTISTCRCIAMLAAVTGNIDVPGGNLIQMPVKVGAWLEGSVALTNLLTDEQHDKRLGSKKYPFLAGKECIVPPSAFNYDVWQAILTGKPHPIRAMYCQGSNMLNSYANTNMVEEAIRALDFFAVVDFFMTPTAKLAEIVLPAATWMERDYVTNNDQVSANSAHLQQKTVQIGECWSDLKICNELGKRLGLADKMFPTEEAFLDYLLKPSGMTFKEFKEIGIIEVPWHYKKYEEGGFPTPSGKIQLYDTKLESLGFDPLPDYREPTESPISMPERAREYPFVITTGGRTPVFRHSEFRNIDLLREIVPDLQAFIHPESASGLGIEENDIVLIESPRGTMECRAHLTLGIDPRVVQVPSHWPGRNNVNLIMDNKECAPMVGSAQLRCQLCRIEKKVEK